MVVDLSYEMASLADRLGPPPGAIARVVQFVSAEPGAGVSTVARSFALEMAKLASRSVWLLELDLMKGEQHRYFAANSDAYGLLGQPTRSSPSDAMFFSVTPQAIDAEGVPVSDVGYLAAQSIGALPLWVTRFRREALQAGQSVQILKDPAYWQALRPHADYIVIDAPSLERSAALKATAPFVDDNVLVVSAAGGQVEASAHLKEEIAAAGGRCAGMVLTRAKKEPPGFIQKLLP